jgi:membrane-bound serine protease (ClpP class)
MKRIYRVFSLILFLSLITVPLLASEEPQPKGSDRKVIEITYEGVINPVAAEYMTKSIAVANKENAEALVIKLDTPGGLDTSMRSIIKAMIASDVPVAVYVAPSGARAASAGAFITIAAHVAAMAPQTNIGAAHPVEMGGGKMDKVMSEKVTNDSVAYIKSLALKRGRNVKWAEDAVRKSISSTEGEALKLHVIDLIAVDTNQLLQKMDGKKVETMAGIVQLKTSGAPVEERKMGFRLKLLSLISEPNVAYILMLLGFYGLFFELTSPGSIFPGVMGAICLVLAFYAFQTLPVNYAGVILIVIAIILFLLEIKITSHGALTIGGIISLLIGSLMLFDTSMPFFRLSLSFVVPMVLVTTFFFVLTIRLAIKAMKKRPITGSEGLSGEEGMASTDINPEGGMARLHGEVWSVFSDEPIAKGEKITVLSREGLRLKVKRKI